MKNQSTNSKTFWENDYVLKTAIERKKIEYINQSLKEKNNTFKAKLKRLFFKLF